MGNKMNIGTSFWLNDVKAWRQRGEQTSFLRRARVKKRKNWDMLAQL